MALFTAKAENERGLTFTFRLANPNWVGIRDRAIETLAAIVKKDRFRRADGPWSITHIDVTR